MSRIRQALVDLTAKCETLRRKTVWQPGFRLVYSSVESYEAGNGIAILGMNPAGGPADASTDDVERPLREPEYTAYLDDAWRGHDRGRDPLQQVIQAVAMVLADEDPSGALAAITKVGSMDSTPEDRIGAAAAALLRNAPSGNIIPFRTSDISRLPSSLQDAGESIGWQLLCLARPRPRFIVTLANRVNDLPWSTILKNSGQPKPWKPDYEEWTHERMQRKYREIRLVNGPLKGTLLVGLPAVVRDHGRRLREDVARPMLTVLAQRWSIAQDKSVRS